MNTKTCFKCGESKSLDDFYRHKETADGYLNKCKICTKLDVRQNYDARHDYYSEYHRQRRALPEVIERHKQSLKRDRELHPDKAKARTALGNAIRDGRMERKTVCEQCGSVNRVEAHHTDYSKPFDVQWLCSKCHGKAHRKPRSREVYV